MKEIILKLATPDGIKDLETSTIEGFLNHGIPFDPMVCDAVQAVSRFTEECKKAVQHDYKKNIIALENITDTKFYGYSVVHGKIIIFDVSQSNFSVCLDPLNNESFISGEDYVIWKPEDDFYKMFGLTLLFSDPCPKERWILKEAPKQQEDIYKTAVGIINLARIMQQRELELERLVLKYERLVAYLAPDDLINDCFSQIKLAIQ